MSSVIVAKVVEQLKSLPYELQWRVFEFACAPALSVPRGVTGPQLLRFAGAIPLADGQQMRQAVEGWRYGKLTNLRFQPTPLRCASQRTQTRPLGDLVPQNHK